MGSLESRKSSLHLGRGPGSAAEGECWQLLFGGARALGQDDTKPVEKGHLIRIRLSNAAQANLTMCCRRQHNVVRLDACEFFDFEDGARRVAETRALLPHL
jgi:hypothetical protein